MQYANEEDIVQFLVADYHAASSSASTNQFIRELRELGAINVEPQFSPTLELFYRLAHSTTVAELARLPQYQTKEQTLHMLSYPLLMAADIIVSDADAVIVGDDQEPHMHFYREIARRN
jgi:tryptophanyl-tRNA synthetase